MLSKDANRASGRGSGAVSLTIGARVQQRADSPQDRLRESFHSLPALLLTGCQWSEAHLQTD
jgi:hypothetical protein